MDQFSIVGALERARESEAERSAIIRRATREIFPHADPDFVFGVWRTQGLFFAVDTLALLVPELRRLEPSSLSLLDVGAGPGFGTQLIASLFRDNAASGYELRCTALELSPAWERLYPFINADIQITTGNLYDIPPDSYDIVTCSHVVEHLERGEALRFITHMRAVAKRLAIVTCPWRETSLHPAHVHRIDEHFVDDAGPSAHVVYKSGGWSESCVGMVFRTGRAAPMPARRRAWHRPWRSAA